MHIEPLATSERHAPRKGAAPAPRGGNSAPSPPSLHRAPAPPQWTVYLTNHASVSLFWVTLLRNALVLFYTTHIGAW